MKAVVAVLVVCACVTGCTWNESGDTYIMQQGSMVITGDGNQTGNRTGEGGDYQTSGKPTTVKADPSKIGYTPLKK